MGKAWEDILCTDEASDRASNCASVVGGEAVESEEESLPGRAGQSEDPD